MKTKIEVRLVKTFDLEAGTVEEAKDKLYDMFLSEDLELDVMEDYEDIKISVQQWV